MVPTGPILFYTHFCLSRVLASSLLCLDPLCRWYFTASSLMRKMLFFPFRFSLSLWLLCEGIRKSILSEVRDCEEVCFEGVLSCLVWRCVVSFETIIDWNTCRYFYKISNDIRCRFPFKSWDVLFVKVGSELHKLLAR